MIVYIRVDTSQIFIMRSWPTVNTHLRCKSIVIDITLCLVSWNVARGVWLKIYNIFFELIMANTNYINLNLIQLLVQQDKTPIKKKEYLEI